jgi:hypothetical protein
MRKARLFAGLYKIKWNDYKNKDSTVILQSYACLSASVGCNLDAR